ncbi:MAG: redoxin domain-containing protein [Cyanobacteria bacterium J06621_8]
MKPISNYAPDFEIPGIDREVYHLGSCRRKYQAIAVVFMGNFPEVNLYLERLKKIQTDFASQNFTVMGINSNYFPGSIAESMKKMEQFAQQHELNFPYLRDSTQDVAKSFKAEILPTVYLLDSDAVIRYQGQIDDCAASVEKVHSHYLRNGIEAILADRKITLDCVEPVGVNIQWRS